MKKRKLDLINYKYVDNSKSDDDDHEDLVESIDNHIYFYADVSNKSAFMFIKEINKVYNNLKQVKNQYGISPVIHVHINTYGGCLYSGFCIVDEIEKIQKKGIEVYTYCEGKVASAGTLISIVGSKRFIGNNAVMLIHQLSSSFWGKFNEIEDDFENCNMLMKKLKNLYKKNTNFKKKELDNLLKRDIWLESQDCLKFGLVDKII
jgi:ATP-dependent protease ClpP protease subunit